ncbi:MAG: DNA recombination/repair protein RecA, partial [Polyangiaceae bacterium]
VMFGNPETTTGGNALKFYASVRMEIRRIGAIKERDEAIGNQTRVKVVKNKMAPPFREVEFDILYGQGISHSGDVIDLGVEAGIVEKSGAWFSFQGERIGQGRENARSFLEAHPEMLDKIEALVLAKHGITRTVGAPAAAAAAAAAAASPPEAPRKPNGGDAAKAAPAPEAKRAAPKAN